MCQIQSADKAQNSTVLNIDVECKSLISSENRGNVWDGFTESLVLSRCHLDSPQNTAVSVSPAGDGLPVALTCSSDANPPVHTYAWYRGEACLPSADKSSHPVRRSKAVPAGRGRTLSTVTAEDFGKHCCVARNRHGSQTDVVTIQSPRSTFVRRKAWSLM